MEIEPNFKRFNVPGEKSLCCLPDLNHLICSDWWALFVEYLIRVFYMFNNNLASKIKVKKHTLSIIHFTFFCSLWMISYFTLSISSASLFSAHAFYFVKLNKCKLRENVVSCVCMFLIKYKLMCVRVCMCAWVAAL